MKKFYLALVSLTLLSACNDDEKKFPGYKAVEVPSEKTIYLYDPSSIVSESLIKAKNVKKDFQLIHKLEEGYAIQNASTDCGQFLAIEDGFYYSDKGNERKEYPGSGKPFDIGTDRHLRMLIKAVCGTDKIETDIAVETVSPLAIEHHEKKAGFLTKESHARTDLNDSKSETLFIKNGSEVTVIGVTSNGEWLEIEYSRHAGKLYIRAENVAVFQ